jgi:N-acetylneuraminate synthase/N,N'-diacetyllegionaminate synthase
MYKIKLKSGREIGENEPCFIIAEAGVNHDGDIEKAKKMIDVAVEANADVIKFQTFTGEKLASKDAFLATYHKKGAVSENETLKQLLKRLELNFDQHKELFNYARKKGIMFMSTPFDEESADFLVDLGVNIIKVASFDVTHLPLLKHIAEKQLPIILSTGLSTMGEIEDAVKTIKESGNDKLILLHCISHYPIEAKDSNLRVINTLKQAFQVPVGYSDHTKGIEISLASVAMGACVLEKHFTLDPNAWGVDHDASISPDELKKLVEGVRNIEVAFGSSVREIPEIEKEIRKVHRVSIVSKVDIPKGTIITKDMLAIKKPGTGIPPKNIDLIIGKVSKVDIEADRLIKWEYI